MAHAPPDVEHRRHMLRVLGTELDAAGIPHRLTEAGGVPVCDLSDFDLLAGRVWTFPGGGGWFYRWDKSGQPFGDDEARALADRIATRSAQWVHHVDVDHTTPNVARMYDYYLGGKDNYEPDRETAERVLEGAPEVRTLALENRAFLGRAVAYLAGECGIRQFIDVGSGLPTADNTHEVAQRYNPDARVAYVDNDPMVMSHARTILAADDQTVAIEAELRRPHEIIDHPGLRALIDFDEPAAIVLSLLLHFVGDEEDPAGIVAQFREAMAPGSYLIICHGTADRHPDAMKRIEQLYERASCPITLRPAERIRALLQGFEFVDPGLVYLSEWRPDDPATAQERAWAGLAGVARKPAEE